MAKLKGILTVWHTPHYYDLITALKDHVQFDIIINSNREWKGRPVPVPEQTRFVPNYDPDKGYDFAIVSVDQQIVKPELGKSMVVHDLLKVFNDLPVIVINHGSPIWPEEYQRAGQAPESAKKIIIAAMKRLVGNRPMVVNSHKAAEDWGWGTPIIHGMDATMWKPEKQKEINVVTALSPAGCDVYYNRMYMTEISNSLAKRYGYKMEWARITKGCKFKDWEEYAEWLGKALIYLDTSVETPMNRARTEAMLSGCAVVQVEGAHDIDRFFESRKNIYLIPNNKPDEAADFIADLIENHYDEAVKLGKRARDNAMNNFNYDIYGKAWIDLLKKVL